FFFDRGTLPLIFKTIENQREAGTMERHVADLSPNICSGILVDCNKIDVAKVHACFSEAVPDRFNWKSGPVLDTTEAFLFGCSDELASFHKTGCRIAVIGINAQYETQCPSFARLRESLSHSLLIRLKNCPYQTHHGG